MYINKMKSPIMFEQDGSLTPIVCDDDMCHWLARLFVAADAFNGTADSQLQGVGMPFSGLQSVGHMEGPSDSGRPM